MAIFGPHHFLQLLHSFVYDLFRPRLRLESGGFQEALHIFPYSFQHWLFFLIFFEVQRYVAQRFVREANAFFAGNSQVSVTFSSVEIQLAIASIALKNALPLASISKAMVVRDGFGDLTRERINTIFNGYPQAILSILEHTFHPLVVLGSLTRSLSSSSPSLVSSR